MTTKNVVGKLNVPVYIRIGSLKVLGYYGRGENVVPTRRTAPPTVR